VFSLKIHAGGNRGVLELLRYDELVPPRGRPSWKQGNEMGDLHVRCSVFAGASDPQQRPDAPSRAWRRLSERRFFSESWPLVDDGPRSADVPPRWRFCTLLPNHAGSFPRRGRSVSHRRVSRFFNRAIGKIMVAAACARKHQPLTWIRCSFRWRGIRQTPIEQKIAVSRPLASAFLPATPFEPPVAAQHSR